MKRKFLALVLGGAMAVGGLFTQAPVTAQAAELVKFETCEDSVSHIRSSKVATVDGKLAVTIDLVYETANGSFDLYVYDRKIEMDTEDFIPHYHVPDYESEVATMEDLKESGTYTFENLDGSKAYYVYCRVTDNHEVHGWGECGDPNDTFWEYAAYLGTNGTESAPSANAPSGSAPSANAPSGSIPVNFARAAEEAMISQVAGAESGSTVVIDNGVTTLSNAVMKELLKKEDVSLKLEFTYEDQEYVIVIPAGAALDNDIPWYGPLYLAQQYGNSAATAASGANGTYEVKPGDCMSKIAAANNMTLEQLLARNPQVSDPNKITVGQKLNR